MNIITSNGMNILFIKLRATLATINKDVDGLPEKLFAEFGSAGIVPTGPMMFVYNGVNGDPHTEFDLRIALPLSGTDSDRYTGELKKDRLEPFDFVETVLYGDIADLGPKAYEPLMEKMGAASLIPIGYVREIYQNFVDMDSPDNETRVQVAVQAA